MLLELSAELLQSIFAEVHPLDLAALARSCKTLNEFINPNRLLWKSLYLRHYDDPCHPNRKEPDWSQQLRRFSKAQQILTSKSVEIKRESFVETGKIILDMIDASSGISDISQNVIELDEQFDQQGNIDVFLCSSSLFEKAGDQFQNPAPTEEQRQLSSKLHVFYGCPKEPNKRRVQPLHPYARAKVYDLRNYNHRTMWGPFMDDGSGNVDWEKVEAIMIVLAHNLRTYTARTCRHFDFIWTDHFQGCSPNSFVSRPVKVEPINPVSNIMQLLMPPIPNNIAPLYNQPPLPPESKDPYGVTGTWRRIVCFLDYTDLYNFNFEIPSPPHGQPRDPIETQEATRLITIKMFVTKIEPPGPDDGQDLPVVHFNGKARSMHTAWDPNANSRIRGTVRQTKEGEIRWTSFSIFHGEERWRSECIQIGGIRSARGVLGTWFDKDFDPHGPAGPTAYWKLSDDISDEDKTSGLSVWDMGDESD